METCVTLVTDATRKATGVALRELAKIGMLNRQNVEKVRARGNEVVTAITALVKEKFAEITENVAGIVRLISGAEVLELDETDGKETIAEAKKIFPGWISSDFKNYGTGVRSPATKKVTVSVHEIIKNATFDRIFGGMSDDLDKLVLTQPQIIQFVQKHRKWLRTDGYATLFIFKAGNEFFVARVYFRSGLQLEVCVNRFSDDYVWDAEGRRRVVVPQLTLES
ncbi:MAG: hypothetical protein Q7R65_01130 [bacterium]|nr:hypothetical protein [bacterium]